MTKLVWDEFPARVWESGVSHCVLYPSFGASGVVWNGIASIAKSLIDEDVFLSHFDGAIYANTAMNSVYQAAVTAYSFPQVFSACLGERSDVPGVFLPNQRRDSFSMCYRTEVSGGYKLHLVYNANAYRTKSTHSTFGGSVSTEVLEFLISVNISPTDVTRRNTQYYILDSRKIHADVLGILEDILYGDSETDSNLPDPEGILTILNLRLSDVEIPEVPVIPVRVLLHTSS